MKAIFPYFGAKNNAAGWLVSLFPEHRVYLEPYAGSAAVLFAKPPSRHEIINDRNRALVTFFRVLREQPDDLEAVLRLTPYARDEYLAAKLDEPGIDDVELARRWWIRSQQSVGGIVEDRTTWSASAQQGANRARTTLGKLERLHEAAARLLPVMIDNRDALDAIRLYASTPDALIYVDPPYLEETRQGPGGYAIDEPGAAHHVALAEALHETPATVVLSGYRCALYDKLFGDWHVETFATIHRGGLGEKSPREEVAWVNRRPPAARLFA